MPDYLLSSPQGDRFKLSVPDGTAPDAIPEQLSASGAFEAFANRTRQAVQPEGGRKEGAITQWIESQGDKLVSGIENTLRHPEDMIGAGPLGPEAAPLMGVARATGRPQAFTSPRQIRSHLDELTEQHRAGQLSDEQLAQARQRLGLPRESHLRSVSAANRPVNQQTLAELRDLSRQPGPPPSLVSRPPAPSVSRRPPRDIFSAPGRDDDVARGIFKDHIAPHYGTTQAFTDSYFNGAFNSQFTVSSKAFIDDRGQRLGHGILFDGFLTDPQGNQFGSIHREIYPGQGEARHEYLSIKEGTRGGGFVRQLMANQFDAYKKMGLERVTMLANIDVGGYAWARYGFLPPPGDWVNDISYALSGRLNELTRKRLVDPDTAAVIADALKSDDPRAIWDIASLPTPFDPTGWQYRSTHGRIYAADPQINTVGKAMLSGQNWSGVFNLQNAEQMERFDRYVSRGK